MKQLAIRLSWQTTPAKSLVMFERVARVPQPPDQSSNAGYPAGAGNRGRLFLGYFILATQKKVTSCRATPGEVDLDLVIPVSTRPAQRAYCHTPLRCNPQHQPFQIRPLRKTQQHRVIGAGVQVMDDLRIHAGVECGAGDDFLEQVCADAAGAGVGA